MRRLTGLGQRNRAMREEVKGKFLRGIPPSLGGGRTRYLPATPRWILGSSQAIKGCGRGV